MFRPRMPYEALRAPAPVLALTLFLLSACAPARPPVPLGTIPPPRPVTVQEEQYGHEILQQLTKRWKLDYSDSRLPMITRVVDRLAGAANAGREPWHVYLLKDPNFRNAAATRGNHVFVWTGLLEKTKSEDELAAVIAHEMAHVLAHHTDPDPNEELKKIMINVGALAAGIAVSTAANPSIAQSLGNVTSSVTSELGSGLLVNPYSRATELEADEVGLMLMAEAKYNPNAALEFWTRAERDPDFARNLQFFSTHPPAEQRLGNLRHALPLALARYNGSALPRSSAHISPAQVSSAPGAAPPPAPATGTDTFDLSKAANASARGSTTGAEHFRVTAPHAVLYEHPSRQSRALGEFRTDAPISGNVQQGWVEIYTPDHGFIELNQLTPENR